MGTMFDQTRDIEAFPLRFSAVIAYFGIDPHCKIVFPVFFIHNARKVRTPYINTKWDII